jgi:hypothetical protein
MSVAPESGRNRIMIYWPTNDGTYIVEFKTADGEELAISVPRNEPAVLKHTFRNGCPMGCSCPTLRGTCNAATVLDGRARRLACFSMGSRDPARVTSLFLGRGPP